VIYLFVDFDEVIDHRDDIFVLNARYDTEFPVFVLGILEDFLDGVKLVVFFVFCLC
jgi:hypothetical protein